MIVSTASVVVIISFYSATAATVLQLASSADYNDTLTCEDPLAANTTEAQVLQ